jgi:hypothetical protein
VAVGTPGETFGPGVRLHLRVKPNVATVLRTNVEL